jgi:hypothetical protein
MKIADTVSSLRFRFNIFPYYFGPKEISSSITKPLYHIFKQSLEIGKLPSDWKTALIVSAILTYSRKEISH